jgi:hypothetical protein
MYPPILFLLILNRCFCREKLVRKGLGDLPGRLGIMPSVEVGTGKKRKGAGRADSGALRFAAAKIAVYGLLRLRVESNGGVVMTGLGTLAAFFPEAPFLIDQYRSCIFIHRNHFGVKGTGLKTGMIPTLMTENRDIRGPGIKRVYNDTGSGGPYMPLVIK